MDNPVYLGDGVYAYFDGAGIELRLHHHASPCLLYLEPEVLDALQNFRMLAGKARETTK
jgi:hypothetical protein